MKILENKKYKKVVSENYNYIFSKVTGMFCRWGKKLADNPEFSEFGNEILDIEISTVCNQGCQHCYKSNTAVGENMSFSTYKKIFKKFPKTLNQVAFGIGDIDANKDMWKIMKYTRRHGVIPNITINGSHMSVNKCKKLAKICGAVSVSNYNFTSCINVVNELRKAGLKQTNIHQLLSENSINDCWSVLRYYAAGKLNVNAIVFLSLKQKGRGEKYNPATPAQYKELITYAIENNIPIGFDSCGANKFLQLIKSNFPERYNKISPFCEPCESSCFSLYVDVKGVAYPCSFLEGKWEGVDILKSKDFLEDVWNSAPMSDFRNKIIKNNRSCFVYEV
jgi:MoaA/NifB/PqqE/SkfB family radical SAM enzyme